MFDVHQKGNKIIKIAGAIEDKDWQGSVEMKVWIAGTTRQDQAVGEDPQPARTLEFSK